MKKILVLILAVLMAVSFGVIASAAEPLEEDIPIQDGNYGAVAMVGGIEYATIEEAVASWTNNTTLTLLKDVTLSDVIKLKSTEKHTLNLGTYTMTAASGMHAIEITCDGRTSPSQALVVNADAKNPGGITATGKACFYYKKASSVSKDRPIIEINNGVFNGSYSFNFSSTGNTNCPQVYVNGGTFNAYVNLTKILFKVGGGVFNCSINCTGDTNAYRLIYGGSFKNFQFMTSDANTKFTIGTSKGVYDVGMYINKDGYLVVGGPVITEAGDRFVASSTNYSGFNSCLKYSSAATYGLYYETLDKAISHNNKATGKVTVYTDVVDMRTVSSYKGTIVVPDELEALSIVYDKNTTPAWNIESAGGAKAIIYLDYSLNYNLFLYGDENENTEPLQLRSYYTYETLKEAIADASEGETIVLLDDITTDETIIINKNVTIDLNGKTVTSTTKKAFEVYTDVTIENGTIKAVQRCVDTRKAVALTLNDVTLIADEHSNAYGNPQPLTIGGTEHGTTVSLNNVNISAKAGYGIITFVKTDLTAKDTTVSGYGALYVKKESANSSFSFEGSSLTSDITSNDVLDNSFGAIVICANNVEIDMDSASKLEAKGENSYAIGLGTQFSEDQKVVTDANVEIKGTISGNVINSYTQESNTVVVPAEYADSIKKSGHNVTVDANNGSCTVVDWKVTDIFGFIGYSIRENGTGFAVGYSFNASAYKAYNKKSEVALEFGTHFAVNGMSPIEASLVDYAEGAGVFNVVVCGLNDSHASLDLEMAIYLVDNEGKKYVNYENGAVSYDSTVKNLWNVGKYVLEVNA